MAVSSDPSAALDDRNPTTTTASRATVPWGVHGVLNVLVIAIVSIGGWWLLNDPETSPLNVYPLPFNAALFWALMFVVWSGFNLELAGFAKLSQPWRGLALTVATAVFAILATWALGKGLGALNPDFDAARPEGTGYFTGALFVLFGFSTYVLAVVNWNHWPWTDLGLKQPLVGFCEIAFLFLPTVAVYVTFGVPAVSASAEPGSSIFEINTLLGWYYSIIVAIVITGLLLENWPWRLAGSRARVALAALIGNVLLGTALYFGLLGLSKAVVGSDAVAALGDGIHQFPSQLGVCWVAWMIVWANAFGNKPTGLGVASNYIARLAITLALAIGTFALYYYVIADSVLHEPVVTGNLHGNALGFMDWFALIGLLYIVGFESLGIPRAHADPALATPEPTDSRPDHPVADPA